MPKEDFLDIGFELSDKKLEQLDKILEKKKKQLKKKKGAFGQSGEGPTLPKNNLRGSSQTPVEFTGGLSKQDKKIEKKLEKLSKKIEKKLVKQFGKKDGGILQKALGQTTAGNIFSFGTNPAGFLMGIAKGLPFLGGVKALQEILDFVIVEIGKIDSFFKQFIDRLDTRNNQILDRQTSALIRAGQTQVINTTRSGSSSPRDAYNTFNTFNKQESDLEDDFKIRNTSGVL